MPIVRSFTVRGTPIQSMEGAPINSASPAATSCSWTSGVASNGRPVLSTYSVNPLRSLRGGTSRAVSYSSTKRSEEHTSELQSPCNLVCRLLLEKKKTQSHATLKTAGDYTTFFFYIWDVA